MPVSSPLTPKSVLRHRPLNSFKGAPKAKPTVTRASRPALKTKEIVPPFVCLPAQKTSVKKSRSHLNLTSLGIGMMVALVAVLLGQLLLTWFSTTWDDIHYGTPRTYQTNAFLGVVMRKELDVLLERFQSTANSALTSVVILPYQKTDGK